MREEDAIRAFLGDRPTAEQLRAWREALEHRLRGLEAERKRAAPAAAAALEAQIRRLREQIAALLEEEAITEFVEDSVRYTLAMGHIVETAGDGEPAEE